MHFIKYLFFFIFFFSLQKEVKAQVNLVPNWSFENISPPCAIVQGGVNSGQVPPWDTPTDGSTDPCNACAPSSSIIGVPISLLGYQTPHNGSGYVGAVMKYPSFPEYREYLQVKLDSSLTANKCYYVAFYVNLSDSSNIACNNIGVCFKNTHTYIASQLNLGFVPQINNTNIITDTANWTLISGVYAAMGGEQYIIIGNFYSDSLTDTVPNANNFPWNYSAAYYFIDDVSIYEIKKAKAGKDTAICSGQTALLGSTACEGITYNWQPIEGLNNANISNPIANPTKTTTYYLTQTTPCAITTDTVTVTVCKPFNIPTLLSSTDIFTINALPAKSQLYLHNSLGQLVFKTDDYDNALYMFNFAGGIYFYNLKLPNGEIYSGKFCVVK